ncbi:MAG: DUF4339 domain-containing protein [Myxococcales bacterium]|nr:DUF4339 domain-containing protein [Myxococcales bacterium]
MAIATEILQLEQDGQWLRAIDQKWRLYELNTSRLRRYAILIEIGDIFLDKLHDLDQAAAAFKQALSLREASRIALGKLLEISMKRGDFVQAVTFLKRLADVEQRREKKVHCLFTVGALYRDELSDNDSAIRYFNKALNVDPLEARPLEAIEKLLESRGDWKNLEYNYRKMVKRLLKEERAPTGYLLDVFRKLATVYLDRLNAPDKAAAMIERAMRVDPSDEDLKRLNNRVRAALSAPIPTMVLKSEARITPDDSTAIIDTNQWYFFRENTRHGPFSSQAIAALYSVGEIEEETYMWNESMSEWRALRTIYRLYRECRRALENDSSL